MTASDMQEARLLTQKMLDSPAPLNPLDEYLAKTSPAKKCQGQQALYSDMHIAQPDLPARVAR